MFAKNRLFAKNRHRVPFWRVVPLLIAAAAAPLVAGCGSAGPSHSESPMANMPGMSSSASASPSASGGMGGMNMGGTSAKGVKPVPTQMLGTGVWQGMQITAQAMTAVPFLIYNGTKMQRVNPPKNVSFHLMVMLNDAQTHVVIPYASVWATITRGRKTLFDERLWPMISRFMGPHYGDDVVLGGAGTYKMTLLISPPVSGRHLEYQDVWLTPHKVTFTFRWRAAS